MLGGRESSHFVQDSQMNPPRGSEILLVAECKNWFSEGVG